MCHVHPNALTVVPDARLKPMIVPDLVVGRRQAACVAQLRRNGLPGNRRRVR